MIPKDNITDPNMFVKNGKRWSRGDNGHEEEMEEDVAYDRATGKPIVYNQIFTYDKSTSTMIPIPTPARGYFLVKQEKSANKTVGGIVLPDTNKKLNKGKVISLGAPGQFLKNSDKESPWEIAVGDTVYFFNFQDSEIEFGDEKFLVLHQSNILAYEGK